MSERSPSLTGSTSNISQASQESVNSVKQVKAAADITQFIKNNYGINLPKTCESRLLDASPLTKDEVNAAMRQLQSGNDFDRSENSVQLDADTVDQLYHLTKHRHELSMATKPTPKWTKEQFEQASGLMSLISEKSTQMRQTLSLVTDLAEDLSLVELDRVNARIA